MPFTREAWVTRSQAPWIQLRSAGHRRGFLIHVLPHAVHPHLGCPLNTMQPPLIARPARASASASGVGSPRMMRTTLPVPQSGHFEGFVRRILSHPILPQTV